MGVGSLNKIIILFLALIIVGCNGRISKYGLGDQMPIKAGYFLAFYINENFNESYEHEDSNGFPFYAGGETDIKAYYNESKNCLYVTATSRFQSNDLIQQVCKLVADEVNSTFDEFRIDKNVSFVIQAYDYGKADFWVYQNGELKFVKHTGDDSGSLEGLESKP